MNCAPEEYENEDTQPYDQELSQSHSVCDRICSIPSISAELEFQNDIKGPSFGLWAR